MAFSLNFSIRKSVGIDITAYAIKKENGRKPARERLRLKSSIMLGIRGPNMFCSKEITKNIKNIKATIEFPFFILNILIS
jgi:hypothetical protein